MGRVIVALVLSALAGCSSEMGAPAIPDTTPQSGARLRMDWLVGPDGAKVATGVRDSTFDEGCYVGSAVDGTLRCLPALIQFEPAYADPSCTVPAIAFFRPRGTEKHVTVPTCSPAQPCDVSAPLPARVFAIGDALAQVYAPRFQVDTMTVACVLLDARVSGFALTPEVPPDLFEEVHLVSEPTGPRVSLQSYQGEDGSRLPAGLLDRGTAQPCVSLETTDGVLRCLPYPMAGVSYQDAKCEDSAGGVVDGAVSGYAHGPYPYGMAEHWDCTKFRYDVVEIGGKTNPPSAVYSMDLNGQCYGAKPFPDEFHSVLDVMSPDLFGPLAPDPHGGSRRLDPFRGDLGQMADHFFDNTLGVECVASSDRDGQLRCVPLGLYATDLFADANCSVAARVAMYPRIDACAGTPPPPYAVGFDQTSAGERIYQVGAEDHRDFYLPLGDDGCILYSPQYGVFHDVTEIDPTPFAILATMSD